PGGSRSISTRARRPGSVATTPRSISDEGALARERPADDQLLDLARPLVQGRDPGVAQVLADRVLVDVAVAAENLHGAVRRAHGRLARVELRHGRLQRVLRARVGEGGGAPRQQPRGLGLDGDLCEQLLDQLEARDRAAEGTPLPRVADAR